MHPTTRPSVPRPASGFTLIEMLVGLAIAGILAAIAVPAYRESVARGARANATAELMAAHQWMERFHLEHHRYDRNRAGTPVTDATQLPAFFSQSPRPGDGAARYTITVVAQAQSYTLTAQRRPGGTMAGDDCGDFQVDQVGRRTVVGWKASRFESAAVAAAACWRL